MLSFPKVVNFHGHACVGLAIGYKLSLVVLKQFGKKSEDEELVAIVQNNSCAVDAVQYVTGCTFGKGNLLFKDYGKHVYIFARRPSGDALRISEVWKAPKETPKEKSMGERYQKGEHSFEVLEFVRNKNERKIKAILEARDDEVFKVIKFKLKLPDKARIFPSINCEMCGEKMMETRARVKGGKIVCIPCFLDIEQINDNGD